MHSVVHTVGAVALAYGIVCLSRSVSIEVSPIIIYTGAFLGGLLPDIDEPRSMIGRKKVLLSCFINRTIGHRTFFHSLLFTVILGSISLLINISFGVGIILGVLSHLLLDILEPGTNGICLLYPFIKKRIKVFKYIKEENLIKKPLKKFK